MLGNCAAAAKHFTVAADRGYPGAQYNLGMAYLQGRGVAQDDSKAAKLFLAAAREAHLSAQFNTALMYFEGRGFEKNPVRAYYWASIAARGKHKVAPRLAKDSAALLTPEQLREADRQVAEIIGAK